MAGSVRAAIKRSNPLRRLPLSKRTSGDLSGREAGSPALSARERELETAVLSAYAHIPSAAFDTFFETGDEGAYSLAVLEAITPFQPIFEAIIGEQIGQSGEAGARELAFDLSQQYRAIGKAESLLPSEAVLGFRFDRANPNALASAQNQAGALITNMAKSQREAARQLVAKAYSEGRTPTGLASELRQLLQTVKPKTAGGKLIAQQLGSNVNGLTKRYEEAVYRFANRESARLLKEGVTGTKAQEILKKKTDKYADKLRRSRSKTIARTELLRASNEGRLQSFRQAQEKGVISTQAQKSWATSRFDVCQICVPLNGQTVPLNQAFSTGQQTPPAHPNCRCGITLNTNPQLYEPPTSMGTGLPGDPLRSVFPGRTQLGQQLSQTPISAPSITTVQPTQAAPAPEPPAPPPAPEPPVAPPSRPDTPEPDLFSRLGIRSTQDLVEDKAASSAIGGQNPKRVFTDTKTGRQYIFKEQELWQARLEEETALLAEQLGLKAPNIQAVTIEGRTGSLHQILAEDNKAAKIRTAFKGEFDPSKLSEAQVEALQRQQIFDYLISNNDAHQDQFIRLAFNQDTDLLPIGIDKGQAFKHLLKDGDSRALFSGFPGKPIYNPNNNPLTRQPYHRIWENFFSGGDVRVVLPSQSQGIQGLLLQVDKTVTDIVERFRPIFEEMERAGKIASANNAVIKFKARLFDLRKNVVRMEEMILESAPGKVRFGKPDLSEVMATLEELEPWQLASRTYQEYDPTWWTKKSGVSGGRARIGSQNALIEYTGGESSAINRGLERSTIEHAKNGKLDDIFVQRGTDKLVREIDSAMAENLIPEDVLVYRGAGSLTEYGNGAQLNIRDVDRLLGKTIVHDGFVSTSVQSSSAFNADFRLNISVPKGTRGIWVKTVSRFKRENELLLDRGYRMLIKGVRKENGKAILDVVLLPDEAVIPSIPGYTRLPL